jgi:murein DD-endopeptidase MepM/ murein hydrolase activator NlpD
MTPYDHFYFARPIAADEVNWPLADYRYGGVFFERVVHTGIDIPVEPGAPALVAGPGKVIWAGYGLYSLIPGDQDDPYGLAVAIRHDFGYQGENLFTVYGHLSRVDVIKGQQVETGDKLGLTGDTGKTTGPHLHFEVRIGKNNFFGSRNPELWLAPPQGWGLLAARVMDSAGQLFPGLEVKVQSKGTGQAWTVKSYGEGSANSDPYYRENLVLGDLPAGEYTILIPYAGSVYNWDVSIAPGLVSYFTFRGKLGFKTDLPSSPETGFIPPDEKPSGP